ncbi:MAG TPA: phosphoribosylglycinamide formyltransferase [Actinomycetales bacterium]|nr:phosphoribosylglycinamide formyltransferase [Actinomycetales bacterium]
MTATRVVVLVSGTGTNLAALLEASRDPHFGIQIVAVGADREGTGGVEIAAAAGIPTFTCRVGDYPDRAAWDRALAESCGEFEPELVISAGFMKLVGPAFLERFGGRFLNTHPALLPSFPGVAGARDALEYGVKVTGATLFVVDEGVDTGVILAQCVVPVEDHDTVEDLTERIKVAERAQLVETVGRMAREGWTVEGRRARIGTGVKPT